MPTDDRPTRDLDQFALLRALIERAAAENATSNAALALEMKSVVGTVDGLRHEVHRLAGRVTGAEEDIRELRDKGATLTRHVSSSDLEQQAALGGAIVHVRKLDENVATLTADVTTLKSDVKAMASETSEQTPVLQKLAKWQSHPLIKVTATWVGAAVAAYLASRGH